MSETISYEVESVTATEDLSDSSGNFGIETADDNWDQELTALVAANADVIIKNPWQSGLETTLSAAILTAPEINRDNVHMFVAEVHRLLSDRVIETEEPQDEIESEEEQVADDEPVKTEDKDNESTPRPEIEKVQESVNMATTDRQTPIETHGTQNSEPMASSIEKASTSERSSVIAAETGAVVSLVQNASEHSSPVTVKTETIANSSNISGGLTRDVAIVEAGRESMGPTSLVEETRLSGAESIVESEVEVRQRMPSLEMPVAAAEANYVSEEISALDNYQVVADQGAEPFSMPDTIELADVAETTGGLLLNFEEAAVFDEISELSVEKNEVSEDLLRPATFEYQTDDWPPINLTEDETLALDSLEDGLEADQLDEVHDRPIPEGIDKKLAAEEPAIDQQIEITGAERIIQTSLSVEEIEESVIRLREHITASEPDTAEKVNEILDKILEVPVIVEAHTGEDIITEAEAQEQLEVLFTELLDKIGMDYTPELVESLVSLTPIRHLTDEALQLKPEEEGIGTQQDSGTHEMIKKLLVGLSNIKKTMTHAGALGRSALWLYAYKLTT